MARIYRHIPRRPDQAVGTIEASSGKVYEERLGPDRPVGRVDYAQGKVYELRFGPDSEVGRVDDQGRVYASRFGRDRYVGRVEEDGRFFRHVRLAADEYLGKVAEMQHRVEGGAALLLFFGVADDAEE